MENIDKAPGEIVKSGWFYMGSDEIFAKKFALMTQRCLFLSNSDKIKPKDGHIKIYVKEIYALETNDNHPMYYSLRLKVKNGPLKDFFMHFFTNSVRKSWLTSFSEILQTIKKSIEDEKPLENSSKSHNPFSSQESLFEDTCEGYSYYYDEGNNKRGLLNREITKSPTSSRCCTGDKLNSISEASILRKKITKQNESLIMKRKTIENLSAECKQAKLKSEHLEKKFVAKIQEISLIQENLKMENESLKERFGRAEKENSEITHELNTLKFELHKRCPSLATNDSYMTIEEVFREIDRERDLIRAQLIQFKSSLRRVASETKPESCFDLPQLLSECNEEVLKLTELLPSSNFVENSVENHEIVGGSPENRIACIRCLQLGLGVLICLKTKDLDPNRFKKILTTLGRHLKEHIERSLWDAYRSSVSDNNLHDSTVTREKFSLFINEKVIKNWINKANQGEKEIKNNLISRLNGESYKIIIQTLLLDQRNNVGSLNNSTDQTFSEESLNELTQVLIPSLSLIRLAINDVENDTDNDVLVEMQTILESDRISLENSKVNYEPQPLLDQFSGRFESEEPQPARSNSFSISRVAPIKKRYSCSDSKPTIDSSTNKDLNYVVSAMQRFYLEERNRFISNLNEGWVPKSYFSVYAEETKFKMSEIEVKLNLALSQLDVSERSRILEDVLLSSYKRLEEKLITAEKLTHGEMFNGKFLSVSENLFIENSFSDLVNKNVSIAAALLRCSLEEIQLLSHLRDEHSESGLAE